MTTKAQMGQILGVLGVVYRRQALTTQELKLAVPVWHELLGDLHFDLLKAAVHSHCASSRWFPSVAELRQAAYDLIATDADRVTTGEAWREVKRAIVLGCHRFQSGEAEWSSPLVQAAFDALGGWTYFRTALVDHEMPDRAHFTRAFEGLQRRQLDQARMHPAARRFRQEHLDHAPQLPPACPEPSRRACPEPSRRAEPGDVPDPSRGGERNRVSCLPVACALPSDPGTGTEKPGFLCLDGPSPEDGRQPEQPQGPVPSPAEGESDPKKQHAKQVPVP